MKAKFKISGKYEFGNVEVDVSQKGVVISNNDLRKIECGMSWIQFDYEQLDDLYQALKWINSVRYKMGEIEKEVEEHVGETNE